jgi:hypothetical protein
VDNKGARINTNDLAYERPVAVVTDKMNNGDILVL